MPAAIRASIALLPLAIRALGRPISPCGLNTGSWSPYLALWAQYGLLVALFRCAQYGLWGALFRYAQYGLLVALLPAAIRALGRPISLRSIRALGRPISLRSIRARLFWPFCASTASASPRGRRERTAVRPLALGLASLYLHQTGKKAIIALSARFPSAGRHTRSRRSFPPRWRDCRFLFIDQFRIQFK